MTLDEVADFLSKRGLSLRSVTFTDFQGSGVQSFTCEPAPLAATSAPDVVSAPVRAGRDTDEPEALESYLNRKQKKGDTTP